VSPFAEPSPQRARLGAALRALRDAAGVTGVQLAERLGVSQSSVSRLETGQQIPSIPEVQAWARALGAGEAAAGELAELVEAAATEAVAFRRTRARRGLAGQQQDVAAVEASAGLLRSYNPVAVQGLLQTPGYAQATFAAAHPDRPAAELAAATAARMARQQVLYAPGKRFAFVLGEPALRWWRGEAGVMAAQLDRLGQMLILPSVTLGILPLDREVPAWHHHGFTLFSERAAGASDLVHVETLQTALNLRSPEDTARYADAFERLAKLAATGEQARALLARAAEALRERR
jgi:transcriptional regulator with XRE-family HTH domain